ncbi:MAG: hypothetical protein PHD95_03840 [Candidatus ainarchaeum sp.]|nr:hypothetical protein [Candidatus ainarchaeum sp.]
MKAREVLIRIESLEEAGKRFAEAYKQIKQGKKLAKEEVLAFESIEILRKVLTRQRIELLRLIREKQPATIYQLAKFANRAYPNVFQDVKILDGLGLIKLEESNRNIEPIAKYSLLKIAISV